MKKLAVIILIVFQIIAFGFIDTDQATTPPENAQASLQAFQKMLTVLKHNRCMNCHPSGNHPLQGDDAHLHLFNVQRGKDNQGLPAMRCNTCHQKENNPYSNVPGAPHWQLPAKSMGWQGLSDAQIGEVLLNKSKNGGRSLSDLLHHMTQDPLVLWAWNPGKNREKPPLSQQEFAKAVKTWIDNGAVVPK